MAYRQNRKQQGAPPSSNKVAPHDHPETEAPVQESPVDRNNNPLAPEEVPEEKKTDNKAQKWWNAWKRAYPEELKKNLGTLTLRLQLEPAQSRSIEPIFQEEERLWGEYLDRQLKPVFERGEKPDFHILMNQSYHALIDRICSDTDNQVRMHLTPEQWSRFQVWREKYNRDRYYWSEGPDRD